MQKVGAVKNPHRHHYVAATSRRPATDFHYGAIIPIFYDTISRLTILSSMP